MSSGLLASHVSTHGFYNPPHAAELSVLSPLFRLCHWCAPRNNCSKVPPPSIAPSGKSPASVCFMAASLVVAVMSHVAAYWARTPCPNDEARRTSRAAGPKSDLRKARLAVILCFRRPAQLTVGRTTLSAGSYVGCGWLGLRQQVHGRWSSCVGQQRHCSVEGGDSIKNAQRHGGAHIRQP